MYISVVIPTFNRQDVILRAVESALGQTHKNLEVIVVDDHSQDRTREVVESVGDNRVRYVLNRRSKGAQGARNTGVEIAKGEWIAFLDSDDWWHKEKLEKQVNFIKKSEKRVSALSTGRVWKADGKTFWKSKLKKVDNWEPKVFLHDNPVGGFSTILIRKKKLKEVGGLDEALPAMQDIDLYFRISKKGDFYSIPNRLTIETIRYDGGISTNYAKKLESSKLFMEKYEKEYKSSYWMHVYRKAHIGVYGIISKRWDCFFKNLKFIFIGLFMCPKKIANLTKNLIMSVDAAKQVNMSIKDTFFDRR
ncbi:glycosyltransferase family 2 protein [Salinibacter sp.]|uniref:glycosyltransferase family 2 protein n=1 Tax=Salinibacter sp. TaxID=2065818 RepID=UPI0021E74634|nr:glycosyltransferase family 2 protein [Salinibacter sp.]